MKKTLLSVVAGLAVVSAANAGIKETCLEHPDKLVWVEKTQRCIPINPCESDDPEIKRVYCDEFFIYADMRDSVKRDKLIKKYLGTNNIDVKLIDVWSSYPMERGVMLVRYSGDYRAMPYGGGTESFGSFYPHWVACNIYGGYIGVYTGDEEADNEEKYTRCAGDGINQSTCQELANFVSDLENRNVNYKYEGYMEGIGGSCQLEIPFYLQR